MQLSQSVMQVISFGLAFLGMGAGSAQDYPSKPVRILTGGAGSNADIISRVVAISGIFAPAKTPAAIINRLNQEIVRYLGLPNTKAQLLNTGAEAVGSSPEQFGAKVKTEMAAFGKIIKDARAKTN